MADFDKMDDAELVRMAGSNLQAEGQGAGAELSRRQRYATDQLRLELAASGRRLNRLTWALVLFTAALIVLGVVQLIRG